MYITANGERVEIVEETRNGQRFLVAKSVPIVKPMELSTGYVPEASIAASTEIENTHGGTGWEGTTPTVNHPRNAPEFSWHDPDRPDDELVLAANEDVQETLGVGIVENDTFDGEFVRADIAVNADKALEMGGEAADIVDALESNGPLEVSSQYLHAELPAGNYDGEFREDAKAIAAPDSVALIPNGRGVCSIDDGCGIAPGVTANIADYPLGADDPDKPLEGLMGEGQRTTMDPTQLAGVRQLLSSLQTLMGGAAGPTEHDSAANETTNAAGNDGSESDEGAESSTDNGAAANTTMQDDKRKELIKFITANSDLKEDSLKGMGDQCLQNTHEIVAANATDSEGSEEETEETEAGGEEEEQETEETEAETEETGEDTLADLTIDDLANGLQERGFVTEDSIDNHVEAAANTREKEERAKRIVANSNEYDEDDVEWIAELPEKELDRKERGATASGGAPAAGSPSFGTAGNEEDVDTDDMPALEVS